MGDRREEHQASFLPDTRCRPFGRRDLLAGGVAVLGATALGGGCDDARHSQADARAGAGSTGTKPSPIGHAHAQSSSAAVAIISAHATAPSDPWVVAHGLRAMGATFTIAGGQRAVDFLLRHVTAIAVSRRRLLAFSEKVETHANSFLKTMLEAGVPLGHRFTHADLQERNLGQIRALDSLTYQQLIGDVCHAQHGLTLAARS